MESAWLAGRQLVCFSPSPTNLKLPSPTPFNGLNLLTNKMQDINFQQASNTPLNPESKKSCKTTTRAFINTDFGFAVLAPNMMAMVTTVLRWTSIY